jgi:hypothetical protein
MRNPRRPSRSRGSGTADIQVKFSDYRGGMEFVALQVDNNRRGSDNRFDVTGYEINPANIADNFRTRRCSGDEERRTIVSRRLVSLTADDAD